MGNICETQRVEEEDHNKTTSQNRTHATDQSHTVDGESNN